jgi:hypothetical protein
MSSTVIHSNGLTEMHAGDISQQQDIPSRPQKTAQVSFHKAKTIRLSVLL